MGLGIAIGSGSGTPDPELAMASSVEVQERLGEPATFRIRYAMDVVDGDFPFLGDARLDPGEELTILVPLADRTECLVHGVVHAQQVHFTHGGAGSWLEVQGSDRLIELDRESKSKAWDGAASAAITTILTDGGFTPDVEATTTMYSDQTHQLVQRDSDYRFVRRLARRHGFHLWLTSDAMGIETAHCRRVATTGDAAAELAINVTPPSLAALDLSWDVERPTSVETLQLDLSALGDLDGAAPQTPLAPQGAEGLADISSAVRSLYLCAPVDDVSDLTARSEGTLVEAGFFIQANCRTSLSQLGAVLRAHTLVNVRGVGSRHSGTYLVSAVRHEIDATAHKMEAELVRNGWGS